MNGRTVKQISNKRQDEAHAISIRKSLTSLYRAQLQPTDEVKDSAQKLKKISVPKEIPIKITGMSITHNGSTIMPGSALNFKNGDSFIMNLNWAVDYSTGYIDINDGDYSSDIRLWPEESLPISISYPIYGTLRVGGVSGGTMVLGEGGVDGKLKITFNGSLEGQFDVHGTISIETAIKYTSSTEAVEKIDFFDKNFNYLFIFSGVPGGGHPVDKANLSYDGGFDNIEKTHRLIDVNTQVSRQPDSNTVTDAPVANHTATVTLYALQYRNAAKSGSYVNGKFNWTINFNHLNTVDLNDEVVIVDRWGTDSSQQQIMDPASLVVTGADIVSGPTVNADGKGFTLVLDNIGNRPVEIKYSTYRTGTPVALYYSYVKIGDGPEISAYVSSLRTTLLSKEVALGSGNTIKWSVTVNQASYDLKNATVTDVLGKGQMLVASSVVIYRCNSSDTPTGSPLVKGTDYRIDTVSNPVNDTTTLKISFSSEYIMNTPHKITYTSLVDDDTIEKNSNGMYSVSNNVSFSGDKITTQTATVEKENHWTIIHGSGSGAKTPVYVEKRDAVTNTLLAGA